MVEQIKSNTMRYILLFSEAIDEMMPPRAKPISPEDVLTSWLRILGLGSRTSSTSSAETTWRAKTMPWQQKENWFLLRRGRTLMYRFSMGQDRRSKCAQSVNWLLTWLAVWLSAELLWCEWARSSLRLWLPLTLVTFVAARTIYKSLTLATDLWTVVSLRSVWKTKWVASLLSWLDTLSSVLCNSSRFRRLLTSWTREVFLAHSPCIWRILMSKVLRLVILFKSRAYCSPIAVLDTGTNTNWPLTRILRHSKLRGRRRSISIWQCHNRK